MVTVFQVTKEGTQPTRLHLPRSAWGYSVQGKLLDLGYSVQVTDQDPESDIRDVDELERVNNLLDLTGL